MRWMPITMHITSMMPYRSAVGALRRACRAAEPFHERGVQLCITA